MTEHTPGRLHVNKDVGIYSNKGRLVASAHSPIHHGSCNDARRLVACWNACEGIPTEMLEAVCKVPLAAVMLAEQRDELLEAVHRLLCNNDSANKAFARTAIAKVEKS